MVYQYSFKVCFDIIYTSGMDMGTSVQQIPAKSALVYSKRLACQKDKQLIIKFLITFSQGLYLCTYMKKYL